MILYCKYLSKDFIFVNKNKTYNLPISLLELNNNKKGSPLIFGIGPSKDARSKVEKLVTLSYVKLENSPLPEEEIVIAITEELAMLDEDLFNALLYPILTKVVAFLRDMGVVYEGTEREAEELLINKYKYLVGDN